MPFKRECASNAQLLQPGQPANKRARKLFQHYPHEIRRCTQSTSPCYDLDMDIFPFASLRALHACLFCH